MLLKEGTKRLLDFLIIVEHRISSLISSDKIKARHFYLTKRFIDDLCAVNDGGELGKSICEIYPQECELKVEHPGDHATFFNFYITIREGTFIYKLFDKRDSFPFSIVRMPRIESNIPQNVFYLAIKGDFLRISCSTLCLRYFIPNAKQLLVLIKQQDSKRCTTGTSLKMTILAYPENFQHFSISCQDLLNIFS